MSNWDDYIIHVNAQGTVREQFLVPHRQGITLCKKSDCPEVRVYFWEGNEDYCKYATIHLADLLAGMGVKVDLRHKAEEPKGLVYDPEGLVRLQKEMGLLSDSFTGFTEATVKDTTGIDMELHDLRQEFNSTKENLSKFMESMRLHIESLRLDISKLRERHEWLSDGTAKLGYEFDHHTHNSKE